MAVIQISQIQVRRGFLENLGQLGSGEFGWALDKLRLFIGNGTLEEGAPYEGNTEILTANSDLLELIARYTYKGLLGGYEVLTGPTLGDPVVRSLQAKLDDRIDVRDFGALGDGLADDTDAIQRCIDEIYARRSLITPIITRRTIGFHPGTYLISRDLRLPPYCKFFNIGKESVVIQQSGFLSNCVFKTTNAGGYSTDMSNLGGLDGTSLLGPIEMHGITFRTEVGNTPIGIIDSTKSVSFNKCRFEGLTNSHTFGLTQSQGIRITSLVSSSENISFNECEFVNTSVAVAVTSQTGTSDISIDKCLFSNVYQGVSVDNHLISTVGLRVTNSKFDKIGTQAIKTTGNVNGVVSAFNIFSGDVGKIYQPAGQPITPVIDFGGNLNYSFADIFLRSEEENRVVPSVRHGGQVSMSTDITNSVRLGNSYQTIGRSSIIDNAGYTFIPLPPDLRTGKIDYSLERNNRFRSGTIKFSLNNITEKFEFHDSYTESDVIGVNLSIEYYTDGVKPTAPYIICEAEDSGYSTIITYDIKTMFQ